MTDKPRYDDLKENAQEVVTDQFVNGLHVHVGIPDRETGVRALNRIRNWLPAVVALSTSSPLWQDHDTGFASWRTIDFRRWPLQGCPPEFADASDYDHRIQRMVGIGSIIDTGLVTWFARLSEKYPTIEVRAADSQLEVQDSIVLAGNPVRVREGHPARPGQSSTTCSNTSEAHPTKPATRPPSSVEWNAISPPAREMYASALPWTTAGCRY